MQTLNNPTHHVGLSGKYISACRRHALSKKQLIEPVYIQTNADRRVLPCITNVLNIKYLLLY